MKNLQYILLGLSIVLFTFSSCTKDEGTYGQLSLNFDNKVGTADLSLTSSSTDFAYKNQNNQDFNVELLGYYISRIELTGPNGESYSDEVSTGATSSEVKGFYQVLESDAASQSIKLSKIPLGTYNKITFTLGVEADYVQQGATGGILDPANGGWLWNWDSGYIFYKFEGKSPVSTGMNNNIRMHIGGWKDISGNAAMINNVKRITLNFPASTEVTESSDLTAHIIMDLLKVLDGHHGIDFSTTNMIMSPGDAQDISHNMQTAFEVHGVH